MPPLETAVQTVAVPVAVAVAVVAVLLLLLELPQTEEGVDPGDADNGLRPAADPAGDHAKGASHIVEQGQRHESGLKYGYVHNTTLLYAEAVGIYEYKVTGIQCAAVKR